MKENKRKCSKCGMSPSENSGIMLHRFPKPGNTNRTRCELWAKYCFPLESWQSPEFHTKLYSDHRMLCTKHFKKTWFIDPTGKRLLKFAVPDETCDEMSTHTTETFTIEPIAGPSQPLLENINILNVKHFGTGGHILNLNSDFAAKPLQLDDEKKSDVIRKCRKHLKKISRLQQTIKKMKNKSFINEIAKNGSVNTILKSKISATTSLILQGEIRNLKKKTKARRWDIDSKIVALRLYKRSPTSYRLLRRLICLPSPSTLKGLLNKFQVKIGIQKKVLSLLKKKTKVMKPSDNEFIVTWDEMSLKKHLQYNEKDDLIEGYQDHGSQGRCPDIASYALVFMIAGIRKRVKQPIAFYLSGASVTGERLAVIVKEVLQQCLDAGLNIAATVCDLDGVNKRALGKLGATVDQPYIKINKEEIVTLFDTPHLLKSFRNLFMKYDIECPVSISTHNQSGIGVAKWNYIKEFYNIDNINPNFVFAPCLRQEHLNPNPKQKMKVSLAAQVLSHSVAAGMYAKISQGEISSSALTTAEVISKIDKLFDSLNSYSSDLRRGKPMATNIKKNSKHIEYFNEMKKFFKQLKFLGCKRVPPSQDGWVWTLNGMERVWGNLTKKHKDIKSLATRRLQQDPLENLFSCIRGNCGANTNPTVGQFVAGLKTAMLSNLSHIGLGNCEKDDNDAFISNYKLLLTPSTDICTEISNNIETQKIINNTYSEENFIEGVSGEIQACAYVCGFITKNIPNKNCLLCKKILFSDKQLPEHNFMEFKEYNEIKKSLNYVSKDVILFIEKSATKINSALARESYKENIGESIKGVLNASIDNSFLNSCEMHKLSNLSYLIDNVYAICVKRFCILRNRQFSEESSRSALKRKMDILQHK